MSASGIEAIEALRAAGTATLQGPTSAAAAQASPAPGFAQWVGREIETLNTQLLGAEQGLHKLATGTAENLHDVMLQMEQARLALQVAAQVRSRVLEAYQEVMRMQV